MCLVKDRMRPFILILGILLAGLFGCMEQAAEEQSPIVIWHQMRPDEREVLRGQLERFMRDIAPDLIVQELYKETEELRSGFVIASIAGQGPDLVYGPSDAVGIYEATHTIRPLEDILPDSLVAGIDSSGLLIYRDHLYQIAEKVGNHLALVYNKKYVASPPTTDEDLISLSRRIQEEHGSTANRPNVYGLTWNYTEPFFFIPFLTGNGGWVFDQDGVTPSLNTPSMVKALEQIRSFRDTYGIVPNESDYEISDALFKDGKAAMIINGDWSWASYVSKGIDIGVSPLPRIVRTGLWCAPMTSPKGYSVNANVPPAKIGMIVRLLSFLLAPEQQLETANALNTAPTSLILKQHPDIIANQILMNSLLQIERGRAMPVVPEMRAIWDAMRPSYQAVMGGNISPEQAAQDMQVLAERKIRDMKD